MNEFKYTPDEEIKIHRVGAIRQMCVPFLSHENGLPELIKNSAAAYIREGKPENGRIILVGFLNKHTKKQARIACLDFVGMTSEQIERDFRPWADPEASTRAASKEITIGELGGHGNGGKCYMTQMFDSYAYIHTARNSQGCIYGVEAGSFSFGYVPDINRGCNFAVNNVSAEIEKCLILLGIKRSYLPKNINEMIDSSKGFTFVCGVNPKGYDGRIPAQNLVEGLLSHHQMITPLQTCKIYSAINGNLFNKGKQLSLPSIEPMQGFETPRIIEIPDEIEDPQSRRKVKTISEKYTSLGKLFIYTSEKNMHFGRSGRRQWRHTVNFRTSQSGIIGKTFILSLDVDSNFKNYMYCDCNLDSLDPYQTNQRGELAESPLTRAVINWISGKVREYCREFDERERKDIRKQDRNQLSHINEWLDKWKNQFMKDLMQGLFGKGGGGVVEPPPHSLPSGKAASIQISCSYSRAGKGIYLRPTIKFYDSHERRIRPVPYQWINEDNNIAMVDENLGLIQTFSFGKTNVYAETLDGKLRSNKVALEVIRILEIRVVPQEISLSAGTRQKLEAVCKLSGGEESTGIGLTWFEDNPSIARVSSSGLVYGLNPGKTAVTALDESCKADLPSVINVTESTGKGEGEKKGKGYPMVLVSEVNTAPDEDQPAVFRSDEPPTMQRAQDVDRNIWWINLASPFANLYFKDSRYGVSSEAWRMYHVERFINIIVQIALTHGPDSDSSIGINEWGYRAAEIEAEIRKKAIESLVPFLQTGELKL